MDYNAKNDNSIMDICDENQSTTPRKRKTDDSSPNHIEDVCEGDMDEEQGGDGEESDVSSREEYQQWDVDSFDDGHVFKPKKKLDPNDEEAQKMRRYRLQMYRSKGFNVDIENYPGSVAYRELVPVDLGRPFGRPFWESDRTGREYMQDMVDLAVERYNKIKGMTLKCDHIVRAIVNHASGVKSYITFMAKETPDGDLVEYQAKTDWRVWQSQAHAIFCRPTPEPIEIKEPMDDDSVSTDSSSGCELSDASSRKSDQEWDVDSLDGNSDYKPPEFLHLPEEEIQRMRLYRLQMYKSKGFYVDGEKYSGKMVYFSQVDLDKTFSRTGVTGREHMHNMVDLALEKYNNIKGSSVTCDSIVRAIRIMVNGCKLYITFMARESPGGDLVEYQAKTERKISQRKVHAIFCRPTPKSND